MSRKRKPPRTQTAPPSLPQRPAAPTRHGAILWSFAAALLLAALVGLAYANSLHTDWHFDDAPNILHNRYIKIRALSPDSLWRAMRQDRKQNRPFSNLTFALNYYFHRNQVRGYHLVNAALHFLAGFAVFHLLRVIFRRAGFAPERANPAALAAAALWSVHPLHTQAVTYIVQRQTLMASLLMLCAFAAYLAGREIQAPPRKSIWFALAGLCYFLALGSKEIALVLPALILVYELYFFQNFSFAFLRRYPLALSLALLGFTAVLLIVYLRPEMWQNITQGYHNYPFTLSHRLLTEPRVLLQYLGLILWPLPSRLTLEHAPAISTSLFHPWTTAPVILFWLILLGTSLHYARRAPLLSFALLWYLGNLFLESSFLPLDLMFEHRLYLPSLALLTPLAVVPLLYFPRRRSAQIALAFLILCLLILTSRRNLVWKNELTLWRDAVRKAPAQTRTNYNLSRVYSNLGRAYLEAGQLNRAQTEYEKSLTFYDKVPLVYHDLGLIAQEQGRVEDAVRFYQTALEVKPDHAPSLNNLGVLYARAQRLGEAEELFRRALQADPNDPKTHNNLGNLRLRQGRWAEALAAYERALVLDPDFADARRNLDLAWKKQRDAAPSSP